MEKIGQTSTTALVTGMNGGLKYNKQDYLTRNQRLTLVMTLYNSSNFQCSPIGQLSQKRDVFLSSVD